MLNKEDSEIFNKLVNADDNTKVAYSWEEDFQRQIIGLILTDGYFVIQSKGLIQSNYFSNEIHSNLFRLTMNYFNEYNSLPSKFYIKESIKEYLKERYSNQNDALATTLALYYGEINNIYDYYGRNVTNVFLLDTPEAVLDKIVAFAKMQALRMAFHKCLTLLKKNPESDKTWFAIDEILKEARSVDRQQDLGLFYFQELDSRYDRLKQNKEGQDVITSGFSTIDNNLNGLGVRKGEIGAWMAGGGAGKCFKKNTKILMYDGTIKKIQDIVVGDLVMGDDSTPRKVLSLHCFKDNGYKIKSAERQSYVVNNKHILSLKKSTSSQQKETKKTLFISHSSRMGNTDIFNISVEDYIKESKTFKSVMNGWKTGVEWDKKDVLIDPYIFGIWLGDNSYIFDNLNINEKLSKIFKSNDLAVKKRKNGEKYFVLKNKHIPFVYKTNNRENRLKLLAGMLDSCGYIKNNHFVFINKSKNITKDVMFLARSLGFVVIYKRKNKLVYKLNISGDFSQVPLKIQNKKGLLKKQKRNHLCAKIKVVPTNQVYEFYGFETDGNHLFLLADFTVVHNSLSLVHAAICNMNKGKRVLYLTTEMDQDAVAGRFDSMISGVGKHELVIKEETVKQALMNYVGDYEDKRKLVIKQFPSGTADLAVIKAYHSQLKTVGFIPDLLIVDYLGDLKDVAGLKTYESRYIMLRDLRGFGGQEGHATLTAIHPHRGASTKKIDEYLDEGDIADSYNMFRVFDCLWTLNQTPLEKVASVGRVAISKHRDGQSKILFHILYNYADQTLRLEEISKEKYDSRVGIISSAQAKLLGEDLDNKPRKKWKPKDNEESIL